ncbi:MAG: type II secretion system GspH family protein [Armatimonadetes bacterium]|nr:type II secretion system GspH family protein [Armatimonadota bacterium]
MRPIGNSQNGLTMLEMIVAMAILAIGIVGVLRAFSTGIATARMAESYTHAAILGQQVASELERRGSVGEGRLTGSFADAPGYSWEAFVEAVTAAGVQRALITVSWLTGKRERHFQMIICMRPSGVSDETGDVESPVGGGTSLTELTPFPEGRR